jgi:SAM-dependent methyltransferase
MQTHARALARYLIDSKHLGGSSLVVELASNDGYLLRYFAEAGIPVLGIDPARGPAGVARAAGIETHAEFFSSAMAGDLARSGKRADVVLGLNVLAHVEDVNDFVSGISLILKDDGMVVIEVPYVRDLIDRGAFDTIYHEHLHYFSVTSLDALFRRHGLYLNSVERIPIHGGSLRLVVSRLRDAQDSVRLSICEEQKTGLLDFKYYTDFARRAAGVADVLRGMVAQLTEQGQTIAAYGAAAKGVILLNYAGIDHKTIQFVADRNHHKHGRYMPGLKIPVCGPDFLLSRAPDVALLLAWNFAEEVLEQQKQFRDQGGRFLIPNPSPRLV